MITGHSALSDPRTASTPTQKCSPARVRKYLPSLSCVSPEVRAEAACTETWRLEALGDCLIANGKNSTAVRKYLLAGSLLSRGDAARGRLADKVTKLLPKSGLKHRWLPRWVQQRAQTRPPAPSHPPILER
jgi:hypothetical protein